MVSCALNQLSCFFTTVRAWSLLQFVEKLAFLVVCSTFLLDWVRMLVLLWQLIPMLTKVRLSVILIATVHFVSSTHAISEFRLHVCIKYTALQVAFTGSTATGSRIMTSAAQLVKVCVTGLSFLYCFSYSMIDCAWLSFWLLNSLFLWSSVERAQLLCLRM